jgi:hypothetical protein
MVHAKMRDCEIGVKMVKIWLGKMLWVVFGVMLPLVAAYADEVAGTVKSVKGDVSIVRASGSVVASAGMSIFPADKIVTGLDSAAGVTLRDGTLLAFGAKSTSRLDEFSYDPVKRNGNLLISVVKGSMRFVTGLLGKHDPSAVSIHARTATIGIRGTDFIVFVEEEK